ncbi:hypothetical protein PanWU01x14_100080, partial [Parasponia andersonii]
MVAEIVTSNQKHPQFPLPLPAFDNSGGCSKGGGLQLIASWSCACGLCGRT